MVRDIGDVASSDYQVVDVRSTLMAGLVSLILEAVAFGAFVVVYSMCAWTLLCRHKSRAQGRSVRQLALLAASTAMFMLAFIHIVLDIHILLTSYLMVHYNLLTIAVQLSNLNAITHAFGAAKFAVYVTQLLIGDGIMIYRAYVVWDRSFKVVVPPFILLSGELVLGYFVSLAGPYAPASWDVNITVLVNTFFVLSVVTNILSSGLIMVRILWFTSRTQKHFPKDPQDGRLRNMTWRVVESILQSAAIYSVASISLAVTSFASLTVAFPACHSVFPSVIGLVFLLIVMRISSNASAAASRHRSMLSANGGSALSLSSTLRGEAKHHDVERHGHAPESELEPEPDSAYEHHRLGGGRSGSPIVIHVSVSRMSDYESVALRSPGPLTPPVVESVVQEDREEEESSDISEGCLIYPELPQPAPELVSDE